MWRCCSSRQQLAVCTRGFLSLQFQGQVVVSMFCQLPKRDPLRTLGTNLQRIVLDSTISGVILKMHMSGFRFLRCWHGDVSWFRRTRQRVEIPSDTGGVWTSARFPGFHTAVPTTCKHLLLDVCRKGIEHLLVNSSWHRGDLWATLVKKGAFSCSPGAKEWLYGSSTSCSGTGNKLAGSEREAHQPTSPEGRRYYGMSYSACQGTSTVKHIQVNRTSNQHSSPPQRSAGVCAPPPGMPSVHGSPHLPDQYRGLQAPQGTRARQTRTHLLWVEVHCQQFSLTTILEHKSERSLKLGQLVFLTKICRFASFKS